METALFLGAVSFWAHTHRTAQQDASLRSHPRGISPKIIDSKRPRLPLSLPSKTLESLTQGSLFFILGKESANLQVGLRTRISR